MKKTLLLVSCLLTGFYSGFSQAKKVVAVMPFLSSTPDNKPAAAALQSVAIQVFSQQANITIVDRSADPQVLKELDNQIREQSISAQTLVQQGKLSGSEEIIVGTLNSISVESKNGKYSASLNYTLQVDDAATGLMLSTQSFNGNTGAQDLSHKVFSAISTGALVNASAQLMSDTRDAAVQNAIGATKKQISVWINANYPPEIKILTVDSRDGKGTPTIITLGGVGANAQSGKSAIVNEIIYIESDGHKYKKVKKIAEMKLTSVQGEVAEAKVKDGGPLLDERMKAGVKLQIILN